ncbi:hypothetical protein DFH06DRAFT_1330336 [Mycena polygramma]|nr:hypothetical protein DFH06DRAFT_1330336 [Mycena polygramma]
MPMASSTNNPSPYSPPPTFSTPFPHPGRLRPLRHHRPPQSQSLQSALLTMQRTPAAWGLVVPLLTHEDADVQLFGAHTAHGRIARGKWRGCRQRKTISAHGSAGGIGRRAAREGGAEAAQTIDAYAPRTMRTRCALARLVTGKCRGTWARIRREEDTFKGVGGKGGKGHRSARETDAQSRLAGLHPPLLPPPPFISPAKLTHGILINTRSLPRAHAISDGKKRRLCEMAGTEYRIHTLAGRMRAGDVRFPPLLAPGEGQAVARRDPDAAPRGGAGARGDDDALNCARALGGRYLDVVSAAAPERGAFRRLDEDRSTGALNRRPSPCPRTESAAEHAYAHSCSSMRRWSCGAPDVGQASLLLLLVSVNAHRFIVMLLSLRQWRPRPYILILKSNTSAVDASVRSIRLAFHHCNECLWRVRRECRASATSFCTFVVVSDIGLSANFDTALSLGFLMPSYSLLVHSCEGVTWARRKAPNLYIVIQQGGQSVQRTAVVKRDLAPKWDFLCNLSLDSPIALRLWHDSLLRCRDVCLGVAHTDIASLLDLPSSDTEFIRLRLISEDRQSSGTPAGTVLVRLMGQREAVTTALANAQQDLAKLTLGSALTEATELIENPPLVTETFEAGLSMIIAKLDVIVHLGDEIHPYANMAWKILTSVYKAVKREQATEDKLHKLVDTMVAVYSFTEETDMLAKNLKNLEDKILAIVKQTVECALFIREYSRHGFTARAIRNTGDNIDNMIDSLAETLLKLRDSLESSINIQGVFLSTQVLEKVDRLVQSDALKTLNAAEMNAASRPTCLQGTRVQLLDEISEELMAAEATSSVLWLSGVAGSGKSTITTTISVYFRGLHRLGAFLFFDRNNPSRSHPDGVIRTLAHFLARHNSHIASAVGAALELDPDTINAPLQTQFETLLLKPLLAVEHLIQGPILIILDALDECGDTASRRTLMSVISTEFPKLPSCFRFLITSRREADISKAFASCFVEKSVGTTTSTEDVQRFISHELERIQQDNKLATAWPKETQKQTMLNLAGGLFIWAATAIKYIDGYRPNDRIETLITSTSTSLDDLYSFTLSNSTPWDDRAFAKDACAVLACIIFGKVPMTDTTIDALLGAGCSSADVLKYLGCVVQWRPGCVARILHASFADYLTDNFRNKGAAWAIDMMIAHQILSLGCLRTLNTQLRFNICGLEDSHLLNLLLGKSSSWLFL